MSTISKSDFIFRITGFGRYVVTYTSPKTSKSWKTEITDMPLIDSTKNSNNPKIKDLKTLKWMCKNT